MSRPRASHSSPSWSPCSYVCPLLNSGARVILLKYESDRVTSIFRIFNGSYPCQDKSQSSYNSYMFSHDPSATKSPLYPQQHLSDSYPTALPPSLCNHTGQPNTCPLQDLCLCCALCLECSSPKIPTACPINLSGLIEMSPSQRGHMI